MNSIDKEYRDMTIIQEKFFAHNKKIYDIVKNTKSLKYSEFISKLKAGDVLIVYPKWDKMNLIQKLRYSGNSRIQGSSFSSIKMYIGEGKIIGYGANPKKTTLELDMININKFLSEYEGTICIRHKKANKEQIKTIIEYMKKKYTEHTPYDSKTIIVSFFSHLMNTDKKNNIHEKFYESQAEKFQGSLFCSSIINLAFISAGLKTGMNNISALHVWPIDFLMSTEFEPVFKYFTKEAEIDNKGE